MKTFAAEFPLEGGQALFGTIPGEMRMSVGNGKVECMSMADGPRKVLSTPLVIENLGERVVNVSRLEYAAWNSGQLLGAHSQNHWWKGENVLSPNNIFACDLRLFDCPKTPDRFVVQVSWIAAEGADDANN